MITPEPKSACVPALWKFGEIKTALLEAGGLSDQERGGRRLGDERERAILVDGDHHRDDHPFIIGGPGVKGFTEIHYIDTMLSECRTDGWRRICLARFNLKLDESHYLFCHFRSLPLNGSMYGYAVTRRPPWWRSELCDLHKIQFNRC